MGLTGDLGAAADHFARAARKVSRLGTSNPKNRRESGKPREREVVIGVVKNRRDRELVDPGDVAGRGVRRARLSPQRGSLGGDGPGQVHARSVSSAHSIAAVFNFQTRAGDLS